MATQNNSRIATIAQLRHVRGMCDPSTKRYRCIRGRSHSWRRVAPVLYNIDEMRLITVDRLDEDHHAVVPLPFVQKYSRQRLTEPNVLRPSVFDLPVGEVSSLDN